LWSRTGNLYTQGRQPPQRRLRTVAWSAHPRNQLFCRRRLCNVNVLWPHKVL
ncbi:hypothetical protein EV177_010500, partial [Coemansia sp. RSA 1804]